MKVYVGMVIGEYSWDNDLDVNFIKFKYLINMRVSGSDDVIKFILFRIMVLERVLEWIEEDEILEVIFLNLRIRKKILDFNMRKRVKK